MQILITALGSYGDVHPLVGLASALQKRGHQVAVITNPHFRPVVESADLEFLPIGTSEEYDELAHHPDLWHPVRGPYLVLHSAVSELLPDLYKLIESQFEPGKTVLVAHCLDLASRIYQEKHGAPMASVHLAPVTLRSYHDSPRMFTMWLANWLPRWFRRLQFRLADVIVDHLIGRELNRFRSSLGLPPVRRVLDRWYFSPQLVLGSFPEWFAPPQPDWPSQTRLTGFPLWDQSDSLELPSEVVDFLNDGSPPIVFAPGSAMTAGEDFFAAAVEACQKLSKRGILLTKYPRQLPKELPDGVRHFDFLPFSHLLPHSAALVHHGGIGTCAQGLAAGVPQIVMPMAYDQLDNGTRLEKLGVARIVRRRKFNSANLVAAWEKLMTQDSVDLHCRHWAEACDGAAALEACCQHVEELERLKRGDQTATQ